MRLSIITLFPQIFDNVFSLSIQGRVQKDKLIEIKTFDLRDYGEGPHKTVDDKPYGGGAGMVLRVDVLDRAITAVKTGKGKEAVILLDPKGVTYHQTLAEKFTSDYDHLIFVCGRYEGYDERARALVDYEVSIGDFVLAGGEIPAMAIIDSVIRLVPGVLKKENATAFESFSQIGGKRILEYPHYTRPAVYKNEKVPEELLTGNFKKIDEYRLQKAEALTKKRRPDLAK